MKLAERLKVISGAANLLDTNSDLAHVKLEPTGGWECNVTDRDGELVDLFDADERASTTGYSSPNEAVVEMERVMIRKLILERANAEARLSSVVMTLERLEKNERGEQ